MKLEWTRPPPSPPTPPTYEELLALIDSDPEAARWELCRMEMSYASRFMVYLLVTLWRERKK
jgi:hypothetical protein